MARLQLVDGYIEVDPYNDHIDDLAEAAEKGYVLSFSEGEDGPIDLGSAEYGYTTPPAKTICSQL